MTYGICNCVTGPPAGGVCGACGIPGPPVSPWRFPVTPNTPVPNVRPFPGQVTIIQPPTEDDIRRIVREELERAKEK